MKNIKITLSIVLYMSLISCEDTIEKANTIKPVANYSATAESFQAEEKIIFTDLSTDEDGFITAWNWNFGNGKSSTEQSPEHFFSKGGDFEVKLTVVDNTGSFSEEFSKTIVIANAPLSSTVAPTQLWAYTLPGKLNHASPAISGDGTVFIGFSEADRTNKGVNFIAIKDGAKVWDKVILENDSKSGEIRSSPSIGNDGSIYMATFYSRKIFHLNSVTGDIEGEYNTDARIRYSSPVFATDGTVYVGGYSKGGKGFYSLTPSLGSVNWVYKAGKDFNSTPAIGADGTIYVSSTDGYVNAINPDGSEKWTAEYGSWSASAIAIGPNGTVYFAGETTTGGVLIAYDASNGNEKWRNVLPMKVSHGGPAIALDGTIYLGGYEEKLIAYNPTDGSEKWSYTVNGAIETVPAIDNDGNIYFGDLAGFFHVIDSNGEKAWKSLNLGDKIDSSAAIGSDGTIYVAVHESESVGKVYAFRTNATGLANGGWPMFAKNAKHTGR